jgi:hypothetical protein
LLDGGGQFGELVKVGDLGFDGGTVGSSFLIFALSRSEMEASAPAMAKVDEASSFRSTSVIRERWLAGSA